MASRHKLTGRASAVLVAFFAAGCSDGPSGPRPTFDVVVPEPQLSLIRGQQDTIQLTVVRLNGFDQPVALTLAGETQQLTAVFEETPGGGSTMILTVAPEADPGARALTVQGTGGGQSSSASLALTIPEALPGDPTELFRPGVVGERRMVMVDGQPLHYEVIDGLAVFQGDIVLGDAAGFEARLAAAPGGPSFSAICGNDFGFGCGRWAGAVVPFSFANNWPDTPAMRARIRSAMNHWEANTPITFQERSSGSRVVFQNGGGCSSGIGRVEITGVDPQTVNLNMDCPTGTVIHEIGHMVGLFHEQARLDANRFITIDFGAIEDARLHNFFNHVGLGRDTGPYDFGSIMHYPCDAFARDTRNTITPIVAGVTCATLGQRDSLSDGDKLGALTLYPPGMAVTGATSGQVASHFDLAATFTPRPLRRTDFIVWRSDLAGVLGTGSTLSLNAADHPAGTHRITASVVILGTTVVQRAMDLTLRNTPPRVSLGADRDVDLNRLFFLTPSVTDTEDGSCSPTVCTYAWDPAPATTSGAVAGYRFATVGSRTITVTVTDPARASGTDAVTVRVVNTPPRPVISVPSGGARFSEGSGVSAVGTASDINQGPDPGPGDLACSRLRWSSSDGTDAFAPGTAGCNPRITFGAAGTRTITLTATDPQGASASTTVSVTVTACADNCAPNGSYVINTPPDFDDSAYSTSFDAPGYYLGTLIQMTGTISDADVPADNPVAFRWLVRPPCFGGCAEEEISRGSVTVPPASGGVTTTLSWRPSTHIDSWDACVTVPLPVSVTLEVTDARGGTNRFSRTLQLACPLH